MKYYTKKTKIRLKIKHKGFILVIIAILVIFNSILYFFDKSILPAVIKISEDEMKREATNIVYETALDIYSKEFNYKDIVIVEKDNNGNISMIRADTVKLNYLSSRLILETNKKLDTLKQLGMDIPLGYITRNLVVHTLGPKVNVNMEQIGNITSSYDSVFESAGINQTRHKIYLNVNLRMRLVVPLNSKDVDITCQIPVSETIIVGKIPTTAIDISKH